MSSLCEWANHVEECDDDVGRVDEAAGLWLCSEHRRRFLDRHRLPLPIILDEITETAVAHHEAGTLNDAACLAYVRKRLQLVETYWSRAKKSQGEFLAAADHCNANPASLSPDA